MRLSGGFLVFVVVGYGQSAAPKIEALSEAAQFISSPSLSPDGATLLFVKSDSEWQMVMRPLHGGVAEIFAEKDSKEGLPENPRWSSDGRRVAFLRSYCHHCPHQLFLKNASGGDEFPLGEVCGGSPSWTPDGRYLYAAEPVGDEEQCQLALVPTDGGLRTVLTPNEGTLAALSPDGKRLLYAAGNVIKLVAVNSDFKFAGTPVAIASEPHAISSLNWVPDGSAVVYQSWSDGVNYTKLLPMGGPLYSSKLLDAGADIDISQILADGSALGSENVSASALWRLDLQERVQKLEKIRDIPWHDCSLTISPNGELVAYITAANGPSQIWVSKLDGSEARILVAGIPPYGAYGDNTMAGDMSWSPDGQWIAFLTDPGVGHGDSEARLYLIPSAGGALRVLVELCALEGREVPWSSDSKSVFVAQEDDNLNATYFRVDILTGKQTPVSEREVPLSPKQVAPQGGDNAHLAMNGRYLYFEKQEKAVKSRIVIVHDLVSVK